MVDVGGALALLQDAIEAYKTKNPTYVSRFTFTKAPAPEMPGKLKAMQGANRADIELVLGGLDILSAGLEQGLWEPVLTNHAAKFPGREGQLPRSGARRCRSSPRTRRSRWCSCRPVRWSNTIPPR